MLFAQCSIYYSRTSTGRSRASRRLVLPGTSGRALLWTTLIVFFLGAGLAEARREAKQAEAAASPVAPRTLEEIRQDGYLELLVFPHQQSRFVRTNLDLGPMPKVGSAEHFVGIDVDLVHALARHLGVELRVRPVSAPSYGALVPDLLAGKGDLIASSFSVTEERQKIIDFSEPYYYVYTVVVARKGSDLETIEDLRQAIGVAAAGSSHEQRLSDIGVPSGSIKTVDFNVEGYMEVQEGRADFVLADSTSAVFALEKEPDLEIVFRLPGEDAYAMAVPPGSELLSAINSFLDQIRVDGELDTILARHLKRATPDPRLRPEESSLRASEE